MVAGKACIPHTPRLGTLFLITDLLTAPQAPPRPTDGHLSLAGTHTFPKPLPSQVAGPSCGPSPSHSVPPAVGLWPNASAL